MLFYYVLGLASERQRGAETQESETQRKRGKSVYTSMLVEKIVLNTLTVTSSLQSLLFGLELCGV